jgi:ATP-binding cassette subfamily B protein
MSSRRRRYTESGEEENKPKLTKEGIRRARKLLSFLRPYRGSFFLGLFFLVIGSSIFMVFPMAAGELLDVAQGKSQYGLTLTDLGFILLVVLIIQAFTSYFRVLLFTGVSEKGMADIRRALYNKLITQPMTFFEQNRVGELSSRSTADVQQLQDVFTVTLAEFIRQIILLIGGLVIIGITAWKLALIMLATLPAVIALAIFFGRFIRRLARQRQDKLAENTTILEETFQAIAVVKAFTNEWWERRRFGKSMNEVVNVSMRFARVRGLFIVFVITALFGSMFFVLWSGAKMVQAGTMSSGDLVSFITITAVVGGALASLGEFYTQIVRAIGSSERIVEILDKPSELEGENQPQVIDIKGDIRFSEVRFSYPARPEIEVLKGVSLQVKHGQKVALVGTSGAGKSTIMQLLMRLYTFEQGDITIDEKSVKDFNISELRHRMAIVPQDVLLFGGTIRENISYGRQDATEQEIIEAAQQANAWSFIETFPDGLNTIVGERGIKLSGGQRQRIAIARAILKNPAILLLDEATSALDAESEKMVQEALHRLMQGRTSIIIAHRLATVRDVDCIYVLDNGVVAEQGTHEQLTALGGIYNNLARLQFDQPVV